MSPLHANISIEQKILSWEIESTIDKIQSSGNAEKKQNSSFEVRLSSTVNKRQRTSKGGVVYGNKVVSKSAFIFFNNHPWRDGEPCMYVCMYFPTVCMYYYDINLWVLIVSIKFVRKSLCMYVRVYIYVCMYVSWYIHTVHVHIQYHNIIFFSRRYALCGLIHTAT